MARHHPAINPGSGLLACRATNMAGERKILCKHLHTLINKHGEFPRNPHPSANALCTGRAPQLACGVWGVECGVWSVERGVWSVECEVWSVECGVWSVGCGVWGVGCGVRSVGCGRGKHREERPGRSSRRGCERSRHGSNHLLLAEGDLASNKPSNDRVQVLIWCKKTPMVMDPLLHVAQTFFFGLCSELSEDSPRNRFVGALFV